ncbi:CAP-Gly domain-containing linker protein 1-like isoform X1 [Frieseomelitta varia]|uniref:CAP-Gly domain-containing linker protein 1-like isoform X1 n=1 Tax=Frieseomelitta varia TaxID=561572 RepID=UPI001CB68D91|nr:CAP-Gly domain-containing linker protein 1-like isoform X1 [Frieseomelitta varia]
MMSDSDDTDVLLLIPPDLFLVPSSSESDVCSNQVKERYNNKRTGVISELVEHMQSLESRISAIESNNTSLDAILLNNSLESQIQSDSVGKFRQTLPKTKFSVSENCGLQNTPVKPSRSLSVPSTPNSHSLPNCINNSHQNDMNLGNRPFVSISTNATNANEHDEYKHDSLTSQSPVVVSSTACNVGFPHVTVTSSEGKFHSCSINCRNTNNICVKLPSKQLHSMPSTLLSTTEQLQSHSKTSIPEMELSEVDELLQEMEATELELSKRINRASKHHCIKEQNSTLSNESNSCLKSKDHDTTHRQSVIRKLEFKPYDSSESHDVLSLKSNKKSEVFADISLPYNDSFQMNETDKIISEFKTWEQNTQYQVSKTEEIESTDKSVNSNNIESVIKTTDVEKEELINQQISNVDSVNSINNLHNTQANNIHKKLDISLHNELVQCNTATKSTECNSLYLPESYKSLQQNGNVLYTNQVHDVPFVKNIAHASTNTEFLPRKSQRLLSLSDFWESNGNKTEGEIYKIKLEEEKFRREHCEHLIQELQKRLLEQQEKVAVALRVDNEKNELIAQFHNAWSKLKQQLHVLEIEHSALQTNLKNVTEKHQLEISEFQSQIKRCEGELSKALDLAAGYKEKNDIATKEKVKLLKNHADELENYKSFVQEAENRCEKLKVEYNKLVEKNQQSEETLRTVQQELRKERLKGGEVRNEMDVIHKALDTCEAELIILRQEKENLQLKLKEENNRNSILEEKNASLLSTLDDIKKAEKLARDETRYLVEQKAKIRSELQEIYQKQVDEVVKVKLQEFQTQLDAAESEFVEELKTRQQVIAECAARKIKDIIDKHKLEINLLEEKHKEEKTLCELQLAEALQKSSFLEAQLTSQRAAKSQLAEQLHSVMQKQWQQALQIISGGNMENLTPLQKIHAEKLFESKGPRKSESMPNCYTKISQESVKLMSHVPDEKNFLDQREYATTSFDETPLTSKRDSKDDLRKYVKMIAEMQQAKEEFPKITRSISSPPLTCREVPRKHYLRKEPNEDNIMWQPISETTENTIEFIPVSQKISTKGEQQKVKPPWK